MPADARRCANQEPAGMERAAGRGRPVRGGLADLGLLPGAHRRDGGGVPVLGVSGPTGRGRFVEGAARLRALTPGMPSARSGCSVDLGPRNGKKESNSEAFARFCRARDATSQARRSVNRRYAEGGFSERRGLDAELPNSRVSCHGALFRCRGDSQASFRRFVRHSVVGEPLALGGKGVLVRAALV